MKTIIKDLLWLLYASCFVQCARNSNFLRVNEIYDSLNPYHVTIIVNHATALDQRTFQSQDVDHIPLIIVDLHLMKITGDNRSLGMAHFKNPRKTTVYVIFFTKKEEGTKVNEVFDLLNSLVQIAPKQPRPKSLLILLDKCSHEKLKAILKYAWSLKFLDLSILKLNAKNKTTFNSYNPFTKSYLHGARTIFPDKLIDVKHYPMKVDGFTMKPYFTIDRNNQTSGSHFNYVKTIIKTLGFSEVVVMKNHSNVEEFTESVIRDLEKNELTISTFAFYSWRFENRDFVQGNFIDISQMSIITPIIKTTSVYFSFVILLYILSFPLIIFVFAMVSKVLKFDSKIWSILFIFQVLIGLSSPVMLRKSYEKGTFLLISVLSIIYLNLFFSKFADMQFVVNELELNTAKDILDSGMKVYSAFSNSSPDPYESNSLFSKAEKVDIHEECVKKVIETQFSVCIAPRAFAKYSVKNNVDSKEEPIMKISEVSIRPGYNHFALEKASPFVEKLIESSEKLKSRVL